ncbi:hypothetical protein ASD74_09795 [Rhizobium sp. Root564]|jgi:hypothetical protein|nr:hypothetical protein ASD74_09795 [Rhizobium sp. Root564]
MASSDAAADKRKIVPVTVFHPLKQFRNRPEMLLIGLPCLSAMVYSSGAGKNRWLHSDLRHFCKMDEIPAQSGCYGLTGDDDEGRFP